ncbi:YtxH domain-containing protein [Candidatus Gottesmanbacteria bacterium]|nr:YtxH domain-containing protein [Candidatus Gottesmanbacteria bacterium]
MSEDNHRDIRFWVGFFVGGLLGAIVLFFMGTREGKKTGEDILDDIRNRLEGVVKEGKEIKKEVIESTSEKIDTALAHIEELQERGRQTTATLRKQFKNLPKKS